MNIYNIIKTSAVAVFFAVVTGFVVKKLAKRKYLRMFDVLRYSYHHEDDEDDIL